MSGSTKHPFVVMVVGASGEWARKEIWPAIFANFCDKEFAPGTIFVGLSRKITMADGEQSTCRYDFHKWLREALPNAEEDKVKSFLKSVYYYSGNSDRVDCWNGLLHFATHLESPENFLGIISTPTTLVAPTLKAMRESGFIQSEPFRDVRRFVMLEKPFGTTRAACQEIFGQARETFGKGNYFPVDHYLVKQMVLELGSTRRNNMKFLTSYSHNNIDRILILADECDDLADRHQTYQSMGMGVFADMVLGHLLPLSIWMGMNKDAISREAHASLVQEFQIHLVKSMEVEPLCWGQYETGTIRGRSVKGYARLGDDEEYLHTPTFFACKVTFKKGPLREVPFYIRTGKGLNKKHTEIRIVYKIPQGADDVKGETSDRFISYCDENHSVRQNLILQEELRRQQRPKLELSLVANPLGSGPEGAGPSFKPYQKLILSAMEGDFKDFPSPGTLISLYEKAENIWSDYMARVMEDLKLPRGQRKVLIPYKAGSVGPEVKGFPSY